MKLRRLTGLVGAVCLLGMMSAGGMAAEMNRPESVQLAQSRWVMGCGSRYRYRGLMRRLYIPGDRGRYGNCREWGLWQGRSYKGHHRLPRGYWVWRAPYWYIYRRRVLYR